MASFSPLCLDCGEFEHQFAIMAVLMSCALCCQAEHDDYTKDPPPPSLRPCDRRIDQPASSISRQPPVHVEGAALAADQRGCIDALDADVLSLILAHCDLRDLVVSARVSLQQHMSLNVPAMRHTRCSTRTHGYGHSAQAVCSQWRELADETALTAFKERWGLRSIVGRPRNVAALLVRHAALTGSYVPTVTALSSATLSACRK